MEDRKDDHQTGAADEPEEDVYVLEADESNSYESLIEEAEAADDEDAPTGSEAHEMAVADGSDRHLQLQAENQELRDRYLRILADHENFKRRTEKERIETWSLAVSEAIREILPVLDNFERAIASGRAHDPDSDMLSGIEMIYDQLLDVLKRQGVGVINETGVEFDPKIHEGVHREENPDVPAHSVLEVFQKGYTLKGRLIRPAMVKVAVGGPENHRSSDQSAEPNGE